MGLDDGPAQAEAEAAVFPASGFVRLIEGLHDMGQILLADPRSAVGHRKLDIASALLDPHPDRSGRRQAVRQGIGQEIVRHPLAKRRRSILAVSGSSGTCRTTSAAA